MMSKFWMKGCLLIAVLAATMGCKQQPPLEMGKGYPTLSLERTDRTVYATYPVSIKGKQDVKVFPQVTGKISEVRIAEGAEVRRGQTLFVIDRVPYEAALQTALANVAQAEAAEATAQLTADSKAELHREGIVSDFDLQMARNSLAQAKATLAQAKAELTNARNDLSYTEVKSPVDGTAGMSDYRIGALVGPSIQSPLIAVSDNAEMYVYFSLTEAQVLALTRQHGMGRSTLEALPAVELLLSDGSLYAHQGRIDAVSGLVDSQTGAVTLRAVFPNPEKELCSGDVGNIRIPYDRQGCLVIPQEATFELQDKVFVYRVVEGKAKSQEIQVFSLNNGTEYIVESGLDEGDTIIAEGAGLVREGTAVNANPSAGEEPQP